MAETLELKQVVCPACRTAFSSFNPFETSVKCPVCGAVSINPLITAKKIPVPERLIVFRTTEKDFEQSMINNLVNRDYVPLDIFQCINTENVIKAYLPMFLYEGRYQSSWTCKVAYETTELRASSDGTKVKNKTVKRFAPQSGTSQGNFAFLCLAYEGKDIPEELRSFSAQFPYNTMASKEFDPKLLDLESGDSPMTMALDTDADLVWTKYGDSLVNELASDNARQQLSGEEIKDFHASNSYDLKHNGRLVLAPFWFVYYTYNNQRYYYIMDGLGENNTMSTPVDQNEVNFVNGKERIKKIVNWCWPLAILMWWLINFTAAIITLVVWFIAKIVVKKVMDSQIQKHLDASRAARADAAAKLG